MNILYVLETKFNPKIRLYKAQDIKSCTAAHELTRGPLSVKYGATLNYGLVWDEEKGIKPECESLCKSISPDHKIINHYNDNITTIFSGKP